VTRAELVARLANTFAWLFVGAAVLVALAFLFARS
jgi:hypothetical protein